jgi:DNA-directed RNA polymerase subunit beta
LLSLEENIYKPLPNELDEINPGQNYAILKTLSIDDSYSVFTEDIKYEADRYLIIPEVTIYANDWNTDIPQYNEWVNEKILAQQEKEASLREIIKEKVSKEDANKFIKEHSLDLSTYTGKYKIKKERIPGIFVEMYGIYFRPVRVGDKLANRHGNKGVISRIVPHDKMPQIEDGRHLDICINPLGIISRMNIGQLFELHLGMSTKDFKNNLTNMLKDNTDQDTIKNYIFEYIKIIDKTENGWYLNQVVEQLPETITQQFIDDFTIIQPPFESCKLEDVEKALKYTGSQFKQSIYDPLSKEIIRNKIAVGFLYFFRMVHIAEEKLAARGIGSYTKRTLQPLGGRKNKGGQRCGEMETACIIGHDAPINLFEFLTTKSDCIDLKNKYIRNFIDPNLVPDDDKELDITPESVKLLNSYLTVIGVDHKDTT